MTFKGSHPTLRRHVGLTKSRGERICSVGCGGIGRLSRFEPSFSSRRRDVTCTRSNIGLSPTVKLRDSKRFRTSSDSSEPRLRLRNRSETPFRLCSQRRSPTRFTECGFLLRTTTLMDVFTEKKRREIMSRVKNRNTRQELLVRSLLHRLGYRFRVHRGDLPGTPDIVLPKYRTAIFVNGCFWHGHSCPRGRLPASNRDYWKAKINTNIARDRQNYKSLARLQWKTIVVWACETSSLVKLTDLGHRLAKQIGSRQERM